MRVCMLPKVLTLIPKANHLYPGDQLMPIESKLD